MKKWQDFGKGEIRRLKRRRVGNNKKRRDVGEGFFFIINFILFY